MNAQDKDFFAKKKPKKQRDVHTKDYDLVLSHYQNLIKKAQKITNAYINIGRIYFQLGNYPAAAKLFQNVLALDPNNSKALEQHVPALRG